MPRAFAALRRSIRFAPPALTAIALAAAPWRARAEEARPEAEPVDIVVTGAPGSTRAPAAQSTVILADQFAGEVRSVAEMLSASPGVSLHSLGGPGQATTLSLRGASADQSLVLLDGIPLHGPGGGAVDLATLPASLLDRLVISRGVLGAQFGAGALGGVVELVPRRARTDRFAGEARLNAGSFGTFGASGSASVPWSNGGGGLLALQLDRSAARFPYDQQLTPEVSGSPYYEFSRENADSWRGSALLRGGWPMGAETGLDVLFEGSMGERGLPGPAPSPTQRSREVDRSGLLGARFRGAAGPAAYSVRAWTDLDRIELRGVSALGDCADGAADCPRSFQSASASRGEIEVGAPLGERQWVRGTVTAGLDRASGEGTGFHRRGVFSASISDEVRLGAVSLFPALRVDAVGKDAGVSPAVATTVRPWNAPIELRAGAGLSFRVPTFSELYLRQGGLAPNADLAPEHGRSVDAGVAYRSGKLTVSAGAFVSWYRDLILYELFPPAAVKPFNVGAARIHGFELQAVATLPYGLTAELAYTALQATNTRPGSVEGHSLPYRPPHRLFVRAAHHADRFESYAEANATAAMPRNQFDTAFLPAQLLVNAGAGARVAGTLWIDVEAKNLLDDRTMQDLFQYPLPGLSLAVVARARL
ncbi:MAG: TonB-dependent receptor plug domain-containing protein [Myxococcales bacterium]